MARTITFVIEGEVNTRIKITELDDGRLLFELSVLGTGSVGDLRALLFDVASGYEGLIDGLSIDVGVNDVTDFATEDDSIVTLGQDANILGSVSNELGDFDVGVEFGTTGMAENDIQSTSFLLDYQNPDPTGEDIALTLDMFSLVDFGIRLTSVGEAGGSRTGSVKLGDQSSAAITATDDDIATDEDTVLSSASPGVLSNDTDPDPVHPLTVAEVNGRAADVGNQIVLASGALLTLRADGSYDYDPNGQFEYLSEGETATDSFEYTIADGEGGTDTARVTVTIEGRDDTPLDPRLIVGNVAAGTLDIDGSATATGDTLIPAGAISGGTVTVTDGIVGNEIGSGGTATVSGPGAELNIVGGKLIIGNEGTGSLGVDGGGVVVVDNGNTDTDSFIDLEDLIIGGSPTGIGTLTISGAGSRVTTVGVDNTTWIGFNGGSGTLLVENGGTLDTLLLNVGRGAGSTGVATVTGAGSAIFVTAENGVFSEPYSYQASLVFVGRAGGDGRLNVLDGGRVEIREGATNGTDTVGSYLVLGRDGGIGNVLVDGTGSVLSISQDSPFDGTYGPGLQIGRGDRNTGLLGGYGKMTVANDGSLEVVGEHAGIHVGIHRVETGGAPTTGVLEVLSGGQVLLDGTSGKAGLTLGYFGGPPGS